MKVKERERERKLTFPSRSGNFREKNSLLIYFFKEEGVVLNITLGFKEKSKDEGGSFSIKNKMASFFLSNYYSFFPQCQKKKKRRN